VVIVALALGGRSSDGGFRAVTMVDGDGALDRHSRAACSHPTSVFSMLRSRVLYATQTAYAMRTQTGTILPKRLLAGDRTSSKRERNSRSK
jgi:hypothetical protein